MTLIATYESIAKNLQALRDGNINTYECYSGLVKIKSEAEEQLGLTINIPAEKELTVIDGYESSYVSS